MNHHNPLSITRRDLLRGAALCGAGFSLRTGAAALCGAGFSLRTGAAEAQDAYGGFRMGIQSYSLRGFNLDQALEHTKNLGLQYWESFSAHLPLTTEPDKIMAMREKLRAAGVRLRAYGVVGFSKDADANRKIFEAAKAMRIRVLSADPVPEAFDQLEKLVEEFQIPIAIHNHGPRSRWDKLQQVVDAVKGRHKLIGACVDTGHYLRSKEDPVKCVEALGERVFGVHLKDVKDAARFTILGEGDLNTVGLLKALRALKYDNILALEYEENEKNPIADIQKCLEHVRSCVAKL